MYLSTFLLHMRAKNRRLKLDERARNENVSIIYSNFIVKKIDVCVGICKI